MEKESIVIMVQVDSFEKAKELLVDLEALNEKYDVSTEITISRKATLEELYKQTQ